MCACGIASLHAQCLNILLSESSIALKKSCVENYKEYLKQLNISVYCLHKNAVNPLLDVIYFIRTCQNEQMMEDKKGGCLALFFFFYKTEARLGWL